MKKFEVVYVTRTKVTIEAEDLNQACIKAAKNAKLKKDCDVYSVIPKLNKNEN